MARLGTVRFLSTVRAVAARCKRCPPLHHSCRHHEVGRGQEQWSPPSSRLLGPRSRIPQELPQLRLRHLAHCVLLGWHPPSHIRGGEEVQYRPPALLIRQEVPDLPPVFPFPVSFRTSAVYSYYMDGHTYDMNEFKEKVYKGHRQVADKTNGSIF